MAKVKVNHKIECEFNLGYMPNEYKGDANYSNEYGRLGGNTTLNELKNCYAIVRITMQLSLQGKTLTEINNDVNALKMDRNVADAVNIIRQAQIALVPISKRDDYKTPIALNSDMWELRVNKNKLMLVSTVSAWITAEDKGVEIALINALDELIKIKAPLLLRSHFSTTYYIKSSRMENNRFVAEYFTPSEFVEHRREQMKLLNI